VMHVLSNLGLMDTSSHEVLRGIAEDGGLTWDAFLTDLAQQSGYGDVDDWLHSVGMQGLGEGDNSWAQT
ncbi:hypothetical protein SARC_17976, partial [Sphaeroforma arctica JP610]